MLPISFTKQQPVSIKAGLFILLAGLTNAASANLIVNGSFETPALAPGSSYRTFQIGSNGLTGWDILGPAAATVDLAESSYNLPDAYGHRFPASTGNQWLDLTGHATNSYGGVGQTAVTAPGARYRLTFDIGNLADPLHGYGSTSKVDLWINGRLAQSFTNQSGPSTNLNWQSFTYLFTASSAGASYIAFRNADNTSDNLNGLDNVVLSPVPEPSTAAMTLGGLMLLCGMARLRKKNRQAANSSQVSGKPE